MVNSAQKLYEEANRQRYELGDKSIAIGLYKEVILNFPESAQAGYAQSQLDMIGEITPPQDDQSSQGEPTRNLEIVITTAPSLEGFRITQTLEVVTAECVFGMNIFRDMFAGVRDIFGGRSSATQKILRDARITCLNELKNEAHNLGANAVIAARLDYSEFSGGGKSMLFLVASGTAVVVKNIQTQELEAISD